MDQPLALIVEDERDIALIFAKALRAVEYEVEIAHAGDEALAWLSTRVPDLVVLDLQMPCIPGTEILQHIRAEPRLAKVPVIVTTAYPHMVEGLREQADWVFFKPVSFPQLRDMAARLKPGAPTGRQSEEGT